MTIIEAVLQVMRETEAPMAPSQVLEAIEERHLYAFRAKHPLGIVRAQMRRNSDAAPPPIASPTIHLKMITRDSYSLLPAPRKRLPQGTAAA
jgi:hypothetical protein